MNKTNKLGEIKKQNQALASYTSHATMQAMQTMHPFKK